MREFYLKTFSAVLSTCSAARWERHFCQRCDAGQLFRNSHLEFDTVCFFSFIGTRITTTRNHLQWALAFSPLQAPNIAYMEMPLAALIEHSLALSSWTTPDQVNQVDPILLDCILPNEPVRFIFAKMKLHVTWRRSLKPMLVMWPFWTKGGNLWWSVCYKQIITSSSRGSVGDPHQTGKITTFSW